MNRPVRIALTLFVSATILIFLVLQRLQRAQEAQKLLHSPSGRSSELAQSELQMAYVGMGMVGLMLLAGIVLVVKAMIQARREKAEAAAAASEDDG